MPKRDELEHEPVVLSEREAMSIISPGGESGFVPEESVTAEEPTEQVESRDSAASDT